MTELEKRTVYLDREPTELYRILKFEGLASSGGEAKQIIDAGEVVVNGKPETRRRKKIVAGDTIEYAKIVLSIELTS